MPRKKSNDKPKSTGGLSPMLPLILSAEDGPYELLKTYADMIKQNFKTLLLTIPGERVMDPLFGVGLLKFLFENNSQETYLEIEEKIREQVEKYLPFIIVKNVFLGNNGNSLYIKIDYEIGPLSYDDYIQIIGPTGIL